VNPVYIIIPVIIVFAVLIAYAISTNPSEKPPIIPIEKPTPTCDMCYNTIKNFNTNGYDPKFLVQPIVKITCIDATDDGAILGYCDKRFGTL